MKSYLLSFLAVLILGTCSQFILGSPVNIKGKWGDNIIRTMFPKAPVVSVEGHTLFVYCVDTLSDLTIEVINADGNVILEECVTISSGETVNFTLGEIRGTYQVRLTHEYGCLHGDFVL